MGDAEWGAGGFFAGREVFGGDGGWEGRWCGHLARGWGIWRRGWGNGDFNHEWTRIFTNGEGGGANGGNGYGVF